MEAGVTHHTPHFHAYYQEHVAVFGLDPIGLLAGALPRPQLRLVQLWAELNMEELSANWNELQGGRLPLPITPLE